MRRLMILSCLVIATAACGINWDADVAIVSMGIRDVEMFETSAVFKIRVGNAEQEPLLLDGAVFDIEIDGIRVGRGMVADRIEVDRLSSTEFEVPVQISNVAAATRLRSIFETRQFDYRVRTTLHVVRGNGTRKAKLTHEGFVDLDSIASGPGGR